MGINPNEAKKQTETSKQMKILLFKALAMEWMNDRRKAAIKEATYLRDFISI